MLRWPVKIRSGCAPDDLLTAKRRNGMTRAILRSTVLFTALFCFGMGPSCAGGQAGSLVAWGNDPYGLRSRTPKSAAFRAISAGGLHNVALGNDGTLTV